MVLLLFKFFCVVMCAFVWLCAWEFRFLSRLREGFKFHGAGIIGSCMPLNADARDQTQIPCKSSTHSKLVSYLSSPNPELSISHLQF